MKACGEAWHLVDLPRAYSINTVYNNFIYWWNLQVYCQLWIFVASNEHYQWSAYIINYITMLVIEELSANQVA